MYCGGKLFGEHVWWKAIYGSEVEHGPLGAHSLP